MINFCSNWGLPITTKIDIAKDSAQKQEFKPVYKKNLTQDVVSFEGRKKKNRPIHEAVVEDLSYKNVLKKPLKAAPNPDFATNLRKMAKSQKIAYSNAKVRIPAFSDYLKEGMVGFIVPEYTLDGVEKGGYEWFEKGLESLIRGCKPSAKVEEYPKLAEDLFGLLSVYDSYWKSNEFVSYLSRFKGNKAAQATIQAVKNLQNKSSISFTGEHVFHTAGYFTPLKYMDKILELGCAYTGVTMDNRDPENPDIDVPLEILASADHIVPRTNGGVDEDYNYVVCASKINSDRMHTKLLHFLKGY